MRKFQRFDELEFIVPTRTTFQKKAKKSAGSVRALLRLFHGSFRHVVKMAPNGFKEQMKKETKGKLYKGEEKMSEKEEEEVFSKGTKSRESTRIDSRKRKKNK